MTFGISAATLATVGGSIAGGLIAADAAGDAADTQAGASREATAAQREMFERQVQLQEPWRQAGIGGLTRLNQLLGLASGGTAAFTDPRLEAEVQRLMSASPGQDIDAVRRQVGAGWGAAVPQAASDGSLLRPFGAADFQADPGAQFRREQGEQGLTRAAAAAGGLGSGKYLKDAMRFNSGLASQEFGQAFDRFNVGQTNQFNRLASMAGIGQTAANQTGAAAANFGSQIGSNIIGAGNAAAAGRVGAANAINSGIGQGLSMYQQNEMLNRFPMRIPPTAPPANPYGGQMDPGYWGGGWYE